MWISLKISLKFVPNARINSIGSDNGLAPTRLQAIMWTNYVLITDSYMRHTALMSWLKIH